MWCPEGFYSWHEAFSEIQALANELTALVCMGGVPSDADERPPWFTRPGAFYLRQSNLVRDEKEADLAVALLVCWLTAHYLEEFPPVAVSINGEKFTLHPVLLGHREQFELCHLRWPITSAPEFSSLVDAYTKTPSGFMQVFERFNFIDVSTGMLRPKNGALEHLVHYESFEPASAKSIVELALALKNCVLCWAEKPTQAEMRQFLQYAEIDERFTRAADFMFGGLPSLGDNSEGDTEHDRRKPGRPPETEAILKVFRETFPEGMDGLSVSFIARKLGYDRKTVGKALRNAGIR